MYKEKLCFIVCLLFAKNRKYSLQKYHHWSRCTRRFSFQPKREASCLFLSLSFLSECRVLIGWRGLAAVSVISPDGEHELCDVDLPATLHSHPKIEPSFLPADVMTCLQEIHHNSPQSSQPPPIVKETPVPTLSRGCRTQPDLPEAEEVEQTLNCRPVITCPVHNPARAEQLISSGLPIKRPCCLPH